MINDSLELEIERLRAEQKQKEWVPTEILPTHRDVVDVITKHGVRIIDLMFQIKNCTYVLTDINGVEYQLSDFTHWMLSPKSPKRQLEPGEESTHYYPADE